MLPIQRQTATLIGFSAIVMWSLLTPLSVYAGSLPAFQLNAICFAISSIIAFAGYASKPGFSKSLRQPPKVYALGIFAMFAYHAFLFLGIRNAPPIEASLLNYQWPVLIVVFSAALPGEKLRYFHILGALMGLLGAAILVTGGTSFSISPEYTFGYASAIMAALVWSSYSVITRYFGQIPTQVVAVFCLTTSLLSLVCHLIWETTVWPQNHSEWVAVFAMGVMPLGLSFFTWDIGMKHGDIQLLGALAYTAPLLSTALMIALGFASLTWTVVLACLLIVGGAAVAAQELVGSLLKRGKPSAS
ncbi:DMT family transporter [Polycladidibacter stylochi]|uniref:aromatic amino acid exporter YddG n=1 Tax=Polycladidibacter stylochi TaxID=1807766 RepID=UPI00082FB418|nr:EamA family transporter [Pseudovibrio stylochi]